MQLNFNQSKYNFSEASLVLPPDILTYLSDNNTPDKIKHKFFQIVNEMILFWGITNRNHYKIWIKDLYIKSLDFKNVDDKLKSIENYLNSKSYYKMRDQRAEIIKNLGLTKGYIYVLSVEYAPTIVKIGMTESLLRDGFDRSKELSTTGVPGNLKVEYQRRVFNPREAEFHIHNNFELFLKHNESGHRTKPKQSSRKETFSVQVKKNPIEYAIRFVKKQLDNLEKPIFEKIDLELFRERKILEQINELDMLIKQGASKQKIIDSVELLKFKSNYLRKKRGLDGLFPCVNFEEKLFYMALSHCIDLLDVILKSESSLKDIPTTTFSYLKEQIKNVINLLPRSLPKKPFELGN
ncbi:MAG: GIY-YIG nuclease family protein [Desulfobacteraceae bacterium]|nr:MAG: GIY-YIG nuclease family protein [Desulfobacteraceae bacterium]